MRRYEYEKGRKPYDRPDQKRRHPESNVHEPERGSRLSRGAQEFRAGSSRRELTLRPYLPHRPRISSSSTPSKGSPGPVQDDSATALERARALIAAADLEVPVKPRRTGDVTNDGRAEHQKPVHQDPVVHPPLPSSLRGNYDPRLPPEHRTQIANLSNEGMPSFKAQEQLSPIDDRDRPLTVRDMEHFTKAIQGTIRQIGSEFVEALAEMRRSEDLFEEYEQG